MLAKKLGAALEKKALLYGNRIKFLHVNCRIDKTLQAVLIKGLHHLGHKYPSRGFSFEELIHTFVDELKNDRVHMIIAFDEVDALDPLQDLFQPPPVRPFCRPDARSNR